MISGKMDSKPVDDLINKLKDAGKTDGELDAFYERVVHQVMARILSNLYKRTPVSENEMIHYYGKGGQVKTLAVKGGALRRGWFADKDVGAGGITSYATTLPVSKIGRTYKSTVSNTQSYAPFVEYGHRPATGTFVPFLGEEDENGVRTGAVITRTAKIEGLYMLRDSVHNVKQILPSLLQKEVNQLLRGII